MKKQNVVLKVGIGVMLGIGAMAFAPKAAHATTPCTPTNPPNSVTNCLVGLPDGWTAIALSDTTTYAGCYDPDGDCLNDVFNVRKAQYKIIIKGGDVPLYCTNKIYTDTGAHCYPA